MLGISASYLGVVAEKEQDRHKLLRVLVTVGKERWKRLGKAAGETRRSEVIRTLIDWYLREPGAKLPERPPRQD